MYIHGKVIMDNIDYIVACYSYFQFDYMFLRTIGACFPGNLNSFLIVDHADRSDNHVCFVTRYPN